MRLTSVLLVGLSVAAAFLLGYNAAEIQDRPQLEPGGETTVTCYTTTVNGTAHALCPEIVMIGNAVVNIDVAPCSEYEFVVDEPHPCEGLSDD